MLSQATSHQCGQALLEHVRRGAYPEYEAVIAADLPASAVREISRLIEQAKEEVKTNVKEASKDSAPDIGGWISQAKQLHVDIQNAQEIARTVVEQTKHGDFLEGQVQDASGKVHLLDSEITFNESLGATLERVQAIQQELELVQRSALDDCLQEAVDNMTQVYGKIDSLSMIKGAKISDIFGAKFKDLQSLLREKLTCYWNGHIRVDSTKSSVQVIADGASPMTLDSLVTAMTKIDVYKDVLEHFCSSFESITILPRLQLRTDGTVQSLMVEGDEIRTSGYSSDLSAQTLFKDLTLVTSFLHNRLPPCIRDPLADYLMPRLVSKLISTWLASAVPENLDGMEDFEDTLSLVDEFGKLLDTYKWPGKSQLKRWMEGIPDVWLRKRQEVSLHHVRKLLSNGVVDIRTVERVETQVLSRNDEVFASNGRGDDWNAGWSDEETSPIVSHNPSGTQNATWGKEEEDVSAWGLDDEQAATSAQRQSESSPVADDDTDAWEWGDENEESVQSPLAAESSSRKAKSNGMPHVARGDEREVTLRETYNITSLPNSILDIVAQVIADAIHLETPAYASLSICSAASDLLSLPGLLLAMYRAGSSVSYSQHPSGQMFLYTDSIWLCERLHNLDSDHVLASGKRIPSRTSYILKLPEHITALENFGKRAYRKEMESQRTIITDLLDGAQGFCNCTDDLIAGVVDLAIASTIDRIRQLHKQWKDMLSHSALLQSIGSLLSTVINKFILDVEDLSDISEPQSQKLTTYCKRITDLEDLFKTVQGDPINPEIMEHQMLPLTPLYTPHWLKFQYLSNILESSLIDIKYLWLEGELGMEFDTEELVDLIAALFEDSPHRRTAVAEIRARRRVR